MITIKYFGQIADIIHKSEEQFALDVTVNSLHSLQKKLEVIYPELRHATYTLAVNQSITKADLSLSDHDEIALLPPFAGG